MYVTKNVVVRLAEHVILYKLVSHSCDCPAERFVLRFDSALLSLRFSVLLENKEQNNEFSSFIA